ncbi:uncharacterized protein LOC136036076 isoform X2 [Artemia franciscana]|uniref:uncharacterized protein LOC136036076 isoform X2 n=1 Tax=Artemia franciscana TaxID=6661 RepID=UPI0032DAB72C
MGGPCQVLEIFGASPSGGAGVSEIKAYEQTYSLMKLFGVTPCGFTSDELDYARYKKSKGVASKASVLHQISDSDDQLMISDADDEWKPSAKQPKAKKSKLKKKKAPAKKTAGASKKIMK